MFGSVMFRGALFWYCWYMFHNGKNNEQAANTSFKDSYLSAAGIVMYLLYFYQLHTSV